MDIESQLPLITPEENEEEEKEKENDVDINEDVWSGSSPLAEAGASERRVKFDHNRLKRLGITVVKDWDEAALSKRGLVGIRKNAFVDHEGKALKVPAEPAVDSEAYVPLKLCRQRVVKATEEVLALKQTCVDVIGAIEEEAAQEQVHQLANYAHSFEALKKQSMRCIHHYKTKLQTLQDDYEETSRREKALSSQLLELRDVHEKNLQQVKAQARDERASTLAELRGSFGAESNELRMSNEDILGQALRRIQALRKEFQLAMDALKQEKEVAETQVAHLRKLVLLSPKVVKKALMLEGEMNRLRESVEGKTAAENKLKQEVRQWEADFKRQHLKEPTKADLHPLKDTFLEISQLEKAITGTNLRIKELQEKHEKLLTTADISQSDISDEPLTVSDEQPQSRQPHTAAVPVKQEQVDFDAVAPGDEGLPRKDDKKPMNQSFESKEKGEVEIDEQTDKEVDQGTKTRRESAALSAVEAATTKETLEESSEGESSKNERDLAKKADSQGSLSTTAPTCSEDNDKDQGAEKATTSEPLATDEAQQPTENNGVLEAVKEPSLQQPDGSEEPSEGKTESNASDQNVQEDQTSKVEESGEAKDTAAEKAAEADEGEVEVEEAKKTSSSSKAASTGKSKGKEKGRSGVAEAQDNGNASAIAKRYLNKVKATEKKLKATENKLRETKSKMTRLEKELMETQRQLSSSSSSGKGGNSGDASKLSKEMEHMKKKHTKELAEKEKEMKRSFNKTLQEKEQAVKAVEAARESTEKTLKEKEKEVAALTEDVASLQDRIAEAEAKIESEQAGSSEMKEEMMKLEGMLKEEQALRKKYFNMMEDMKGKIRVFARCRPMAGYEKEKKCSQVVNFPDETTLTVETEKATKEFVYDHCFGPTSTQEEIFEDTRNLIQSSLDGFNVCVFAYGQTGSGKTFTMVGSEEHPGIVRRTISEIFGYIDRNQGKMKLNVKLYMVELYRDNLLDLLRDKKKKGVKLEIKKDKKGTVFVKNATIVNVHSATELFKLFDTANANRKTASTKMNAASSRSHLVFSLILENTNVATKKTNVGKISLVDLAGSERADKTGATDETLKEAMSINKSLSALGDVISALSSGEKHIPYRNNTLTQLMSDSLGGNAKTLMFVNVSPADYNAEETVSSLVYASRVKLIKNNASKTNESEEVTSLKNIIEELKQSGGKSALLDAYEKT